MASSQLYLILNSNSKDLYVLVRRASFFDNVMMKILIAGEEHGYMIEIKENDDSDNRAALIDLLTEHQSTHITDEILDDEMYSIGAYDDQDYIGGAFAKRFGNTVHLSLLAVKTEWRGHAIGQKLVAKIEAFARERESRYLTVNTQDYQALAFYQKLGFTVFGSIEDTPFVGTTKYYLKKRLD